MSLEVHQFIDFCPCSFLLTAAVLTSGLLTDWMKSCDQSRKHIKKQRYYFANKSLSSQGYGFSSSHVWMWELDCEESWALKNWCFWTMVLEKTLESPLDCREIQPVNPKENQSWVFTGRTDAEAKTPVLLPPDRKNWLIWKDPDAGKDWRQEEGDHRGWDVWMASPTQCMWLWVNSGNWWWTGRPDVLQSMGLQRVGHDWVTELNWVCCVVSLDMVIDLSDLVSCWYIGLVLSAVVDLFFLRCLPLLRNFRLKDIVHYCNVLVSIFLATESTFFLQACFEWFRRNKFFPHVESWAMSRNDEPLGVRSENRSYHGLKLNTPCITPLNISLMAMCLINIL